MSHSSRLLYQKTVDVLSASYTDEEASSLAYYLLEERLGLKKHQIALNEDTKEENEHIIERLNTDFKRLLAFEPIQYILGKTDFFGLELAVAHGVLIPRPETEELMYLIQDEFGKKDQLRVADYGTGSGAIAAALQFMNNSWEVSALELSPAAYSIARSNFAKHQLPITLVQGSMLKPQEQFSELDLLVSNPPYVKEEERSMMEPNVLGHEPSMALFVPDDDALIFYEALAARALESLKTGGWIFVEINEALGPQTASVFQEHGLTHVEVIKDFLSKDRFVRAQKTNNQLM